LDVIDPTGCAAILYCGASNQTVPDPMGVNVPLDIPGMESKNVTFADMLAHPEKLLAAASALVLTLGATVAQTPRNSLMPTNSSEEITPAMQVLRRIQKIAHHPPIVLLTHNGAALEACCLAVQLGVSHFIDTDAEDWRSRLANTLLQIIDRHQKQPIRKAATPVEMLDSVGIRAISPAMQNLIVLANRAAQVSDATVLIHGESGTGKQLLAEAIHRLDPKRGTHAFVSVNCAAITGTLAESELFGHVRGAFSGATGPREGYFRSADKGTIMLDEISELPMVLQPKLLRVLQEGRVLPVGSDREEPIDVRVVAASNVSLAEKVTNGTFRLDLYQRLNVIQLVIPPLRQRTEDIPLLVRHFIEKYQSYCPQEITEVDPHVYELLKRRMGNGNVRELENIIRQALVFKQHGTRLELSDMPAALLVMPETPAPTELIPTAIANNLVALIRDGRLSLKSAMATFEKTLIQQAAQNSPHLTKSQLAEVLGMPRRTLYYKLDANAQE